MLFLQIITRSEADVMEKTEDENDRRSDYVFAVPGHALTFDGSSEICDCHPGTRTVGRLLNYAYRLSPGCNVHPEFFQFKAQNNVFRALLFVANREIDVQEELRFDYGDERSLAMFGSA